jgi:mono/diheme cytochrome c family protein
MKALMVFIATALLSTAIQAAPATTKGDPKIGKTLHDKSCTSCHTKMYGGDGSKIYTRSDHKTQSAAQLAARVAGCNANTGAGWFPEDEAHVAAYLNQQYYKFK